MLISLSLSLSLALRCSHSVTFHLKVGLCTRASLFGDTHTISGHVLDNRSYFVLAKQHRTFRSNQSHTKSKTRKYCPNRGGSVQTCQEGCSTKFRQIASDCKLATGSRSDLSITQFQILLHTFNHSTSTWLGIELDVQCIIYIY